MASFKITFPGVSAKLVSSAMAMRRMLRSTLLILWSFQCWDKLEMSLSMISRSRETASTSWRAKSFVTRCKFTSSSSAASKWFSKKSSVSVGSSLRASAENDTWSTNSRVLRLEGTEYSTPDYNCFKRLAISMADIAASAPLLPALEPARSMACSMESVVSTPKPTAMLASREVCATPLATSDAIYSKCGVEPRNDGTKGYYHVVLPGPHHGRHNLRDFESARHSVL